MQELGKYSKKKHRFITKSDYSTILAIFILNNFFLVYLTNIFTVVQQ